MFIRVFKGLQRKEMLLNVDHISKIEVEYTVEGKEGEFWLTSSKEGAEDPATHRFYRVHLGGETFLLNSNPGDPVMTIIEEIYKSAVKG
jgi:hypothetical protein